MGRGKGRGHPLVNHAAFDQENLVVHHGSALGDGHGAQTPHNQDRMGHNGDG